MLMQREKHELDFFLTNNRGYEMFIILLQNVDSIWLQPNCQAETSTRKYKFVVADSTSVKSGKLQSEIGTNS